ncbi:gliding motility-associated C-terminal domain-containing protein [Agriterribacter sp.]|uniref:gliding motility-associated C-terminal domain-containing protein n=1 Tax=Agriterribacter sp. TaxID=2821509 RepID=UPI002C574CC0|nr:gliding motility-associated C-terminal domain-containing protein [Agriterribacter sp.]HTN08881.1 gliding motility-associated C-terminal domain-containing protein [Agriterribacter sp.]
MKPFLITVTLVLYAAVSKSQCASSADMIPADSLIICAHTTYTLTLPGGPGVSYTWSTGETTNSININQSGKYWVSLANAVCPPVTDTVTILFNSLIQQPSVKDTLLCLNQPAPSLIAWGEKLMWYSSPTATAGSPVAPVPSTADTGMAYYYVSQTILGCESPRARLTVEVIEKPAFDLGENIVIPCGIKGVVLQTVEQKYTSYTWQNGSTAPEFLATAAGSYILKAHNICGSFADTVQTVLCNTRCVNFPNAFTPNNDGLNDTFKPGAFCPVTTYSFMIYDRFGKKVFESKHPSLGWDGKINGKKADMGTYVYYCIYDDFMLKRELLLKGTVTLIR